MNILLDAFFDLNYGDDLFIETVTGMFPGYKFYSFLEYYPPQVIRWAKKIPNLFLLPECGSFLENHLFDAYICVGGDIFPNNGDFTKRKSYVKSVKKVHGTVAFWGFSLFRDYSEQTRRDLVDMLRDADIIAPRDEPSARLLRELLPEKEISSVADLAFLSDWPHKDTNRATGLLGISVRRPNYATEQDMQEYTAGLQAVINAYLEGSTERTVTLFSLSSGNTSDAEVSEAILSGVTEKDRAIHRIYAGDTAAIKEELAGCDLVICTRLHAMISCIAMNVPFIPVIYEVKMEHLLADIGYQGQTLFFPNTQDIQLTQSLSEAGQTDGTLLIGKTAAVRDRLQQLLRDCHSQVPIRAEAWDPTCKERKQLTETFQAALQQRETDVATLEAALQQRGRDVATLEAALQQRAADVAALEAILAQKEADLRKNILYKIAGRLTKLGRAVKSAFKERNTTL